MGRHSQHTFQAVRLKSDHMLEVMRLPLHSTSIEKGRVLMYNLSNLRTVSCCCHWQVTWAKYILITVSQSIGRLVAPTDPVALK